MDDKPLLSICCITYNHEEFIKDTLDGFLMQKTDFSIEIIIHDDASTDNTAQIIKDYARKDNKIVPILRSTNLKSTGEPIFPITFKKAKGKFIAMCEGDDYWIDPLKLQKQVDFLENNQDFSLCCAGFVKKNLKYGTKESIVYYANDNNLEGFVFDINDMAERWLTQPLTCLFVKDDMDFETYKRYKYFRDIHLFYHLVKLKKGYYFSSEFGVYNIHSSGLTSMDNGIVNTNAAYKCYKELESFNNDSFIRRKRFITSVSLLTLDFNYKYDDNTIERRFSLFKESLGLIKTLSEFNYFFKSIFKNYLSSLVPARFKKIK